MDKAEDTTKGEAQCKPLLADFTAQGLVEEEEDESNGNGDLMSDDSRGL